MKKLIYTTTAIIAFAVSANAQVGIGITSDQVSDKAILDFPDDADKAILLPYVDAADANSVAGTVIYDATDGTTRYKDNSGNWVALTTAPEDSQNIEQHTLPTVDNAEGVTITDLSGFDQQSVPGVLVLESNTRALALPKVNGVENLAGAKAGMICFDTSRNALAMFNGEVWILRN